MEMFELNRRIEVIVFSAQFKTYSWQIYAGRGKIFKLCDVAEFKSIANDSVALHAGCTK